MESRDIVEDIIRTIEKDSYINITEFLENKNLKNIKIKDLVKEIEQNYSRDLILDSKNTEIYSYDLVYNYFKLKLFKSLETGNDIDLSSDDFHDFKPDDLIRIFSMIDSEILTYLLDQME